MMPKVVNDSEKHEFASWNSYWEFTRRVRQNRRYVWDDEVRVFLETVLGTMDGRDSRLPPGTVLWRAQLGIEWKPHDFEDMNVRVGFPPERMKPDSRVAREGRANSAGIPVLYLATTEQTAISEVRPWLGSEVSVAQFRTVRDLTAVDLTRGFGEASFGQLTLGQLSGEETVDAETKERAVWTDIDNSFSRPIELSESAADYVPTQILAELFQDAGYDAIVYRSQFGENGRNVAIFNIDDAEIINCGPYEVSGIDVKYGLVGNHWFAKQKSKRRLAPKALFA